jgi:hypothetical protein
MNTALEKLKHFFISAKQKSATTEVIAPKNANPDCRQTNQNQNGSSFNTLTCGICIFNKFKIRMQKKGYNIPHKKETTSFPII